MAERTLIWDEFDHAFRAKRCHCGRIKPARTYRNPLVLARDGDTMLRSGEYASQTELAWKIGVSRVRINQFLRLLKMPLEIQQSVIGMGDPLPSRKITERKLRALLSSRQPEHFKDR